MPYKFAIYYLFDGAPDMVLWKGETPSEAKKTFIETFDEKDQMEIHDIRIFQLVEIE